MSISNVSKSYKYTPHNNAFELQILPATTLCLSKMSPFLYLWQLSQTSSNSANSCY